MSPSPESGMPAPSPPEGPSPLDLAVGFGLFGGIGIALVAFAIFTAYPQRFQAHSEYTVVLDHAFGVPRTLDVTMSGMSVGRLNDLRLDETHRVVGTLWVRDEYASLFKVDSPVFVARPIGLPSLEIGAGQGEVVAPGSTVRAFNTDPLLVLSSLDLETLGITEAARDPRLAGKGADAVRETFEILDTVHDMATHELGPLLAHVDDTLDAAEGTLGKAEGTLGKADRTLGELDPVLRDVDEMAVDLETTALAVQKAPFVRSKVDDALEEQAAEDAAREAEGGAQTAPQPAPTPATP